MIKAFVNTPSPRLAECQLSYVDRMPIDLSLARQQHGTYVQALIKLGVEVDILHINPHCPDGVFVEDPVIILDETAIITSMGNPERRAEIPAIKEYISGHRQIQEIRLPAKLEGGDVLQIGRKIFIGLSSRTNLAGMEALKIITQQYGYEIILVRVTGCLHLKTAVTALDEERLLINPSWLDTTPFRDFQLVVVPSEEPWGANILRLPMGVIANAAYPGTCHLIASLGYRLEAVDISEYGKAEAGLTCMSVVYYER